MNLNKLIIFTSFIEGNGKFYQMIFAGISYSCKEHKCRCEIPGEPTQITSTKRNKNDAKAECDEITTIVEEVGGHCTFYSE